MQELFLNYVSTLTLGEKVKTWLSTVSSSFWTTVLDYAKKIRIFRTVSISVMQKCTKTKEQKIIVKWNIKPWNNYQEKKFDSEIVKKYIWDTLGNQSKQL